MGCLWWNGMKKDMAKFMEKCQNYENIKVQHWRLGGVI